MVQAPQTKIRLLFVALLGALFFAACLGSKAHAAILKPPPGKVFFGVTDTGDASDFRDFARAVGKHPAVIQTFHAWGNSWEKSLPRWRATRARPMLHMTTRADNGEELITPKQIARGRGDDYLIRINTQAARRNLRIYLRPLGEPNRCLNYYAGVDCAGNVRGGDYSYGWYKQAFRRIAIITRGGAKRGFINARLKDLRLPKVQNVGQSRRLPRRLPKAPVSLVWSPLPAGSPTVRANLPARYWPGKDWVDWVGTDFYNRYNNWKHLGRFYKKWALGKNKPMALTEFGLWGSDSPSFIKRIFKFTRNRKKIRMMVYYQDFGESNSFRIQNFPQGRKVLSQFLNKRDYPKFAPKYPRFR
ncbi:MAG TPA: hypothetical protein PLO12_08655 [Solirubrobacterales bacterium]|nr:hypothetical protein [Solirubrobacterales bacterium]HNG55951.1 hypothetical protein [Solirubrobacterales bacterium]HNK66437.1 hypothetical protein [Solirubrobacterales bacterium]